MPAIVVVDENYMGICSAAKLNISWKLSLDGAARLTKGFFLNVRYVYEKKEKEVNVTFNISLNDDTEDWYNTVFFYECISAYPNTTYTITIDSYPVSSGVRTSAPYTTFKTSENLNQSLSQPDANNSAKWVAVLGVEPQPSRNIINICFSSAPLEYRFKSYHIDLIDKSSPFGIYRQQTVPSGNVSQSGETCLTFTDICPGYYKVNLYADNTECACKTDGKCSTSGCIVTVVSSVDMSDAPQPCQSSQLVSPTGHSSNVTVKIIAALFGTLIALALIVLLICIFRDRLPRCERVGSKPSDPSNLSPAEWGEERVLIVYAKDNEAHRKVVCVFAAFLQDVCDCDVEFDESRKSSVDIAQIGADEWLLRRLHDCPNVILIHSKGAFCQYQEYKGDKKCEPNEPHPLVDQFIPAIQLILRDQLRMKCQKKIYHVYFPYTKKQHIIELKFKGKIYQLMKRIDELYLNLHHEAKYSSKTTKNSFINETDYTHVEKGLQLETAINEAVEYHVKHPDWFEMNYQIVPLACRTNEKPQVRTSQQEVEPNQTSRIIVEVKNELQDTSILHNSRLDSGCCDCCNDQGIAFPDLKCESQSVNSSPLVHSSSGASLTFIPPVLDDDSSLNSSLYNEEHTRYRSDTRSLDECSESVSYLDYNVNNKMRTAPSHHVLTISTDSTAAFLSER